MRAAPCSLVFLIYQTLRKYRTASSCLSDSIFSLLWPPWELTFLQCLPHAECCSDHIVSRVKNQIVCVCVEMCSHECRCQQKPEMADSQEMECQVVVSHPTRVLGVELSHLQEQSALSPSLQSAAFSPLSHTLLPSGECML